MNSQREVLEEVRDLAKKVISLPDARGLLCDQKSFDLVSHLSSVTCINDMNELMQDLSEHWKEEHGKRVDQTQIIEILRTILGG